MIRLRLTILKVIAAFIGLSSCLAGADTAPEDCPDHFVRVNLSPAPLISTRLDRSLYVQVAESPSAQLREVQIDSLLYDRSRWRIEEWDFGGRHYSFFEAGFKNLESDSREVHQTVNNHLLQFPQTDLLIRFGPLWQEDFNRLRQLRWATHDVVMKVYKESKDYLGWGDFSILKHVNKISGNSDVFVLLEFNRERATWSTINWKDVHDRLMGTVQVSYYGNPINIVPTHKSLALAREVNIDRSMKFPFEYRVDLPRAEEVHRVLSSKFDLSTTCEITRFIARSAYLPKPVKDKLLFEMFDILLKRGMKTILASLDDKTFRLFRKDYGFQRLLDFPVKGNRQYENVAYLRVDSPEFAGTFRKLYASHQQVAVRRPYEGRIR